jgi:hypothetical protein
MATPVHELGPSNGASAVRQHAEPQHPGLIFLKKVPMMTSTTTTDNFGN